MNTSSTADLIEDISRWYESYLGALPDILSGALPRLFDFFAVPLLSLSSSGAVTLRDAADVVGMYDSMFDGLHPPEQVHAIECGRTIRVLNARSAVIAATWERQDAEGNTLEKIPYENLVADSGDGWRIVVMTKLDPELGAVGASPITLESPAMRITPQTGT
ncbi:hypothetical protein [Nocardia transvalensis]|uniref:DUF6841 family protein n=1 Tax=Nocardia transvalensis TaxID=37333 RepID=UPI00189511F2|nr:hypothetical protein [Nocardia transvalensis]MBF6327707.1 hypothetical protein [Nocardia transvalensis]